MKIYFTTRKEMRNFAKKSSKKSVDMGSDKPTNRRWAVKVK